MFNDLTPTQREALTHYLADFVTAEKKARMTAVLNQRTRHFAVLLENVFQPHNASAVLRSCDCFGVQNIHIVADRNPYSINPNVTQGASKWLTLQKYDNAGSTAASFAQLRAQGYRLAATTLRPSAIPLREVDVTQKTLFCFGAEEIGLSEEAHSLADIFVHIPMVGFTQSLNISVSAALCLHELTHRLKASEVTWGLTAVEKAELTLEWYFKASNHGRPLARKFYADNQWPLPPWLELTEEEREAMADRER